MLFNRRKTKTAGSFLFLLSLTAILLCGCGGTKTPAETTLSVPESEVSTSGEEVTEAPETETVLESEAVYTLEETDLSLHFPADFGDRYEEILFQIRMDRRMEELGGTYAETGKPAVALTFDDGPSEETEKILDVLEQYDAKASFFIVGQNVEGKEDTLKRELALGCELGTHTWNHSDLATLSDEQIEKQMKKSITAIEKASGGTVTLMRPPYGSVTSHVKEILDLPIMFWSLDTLDWKTRDAASTVSAVKDNVKGGDIILFHDLYSETESAVETIVPWLIENGYQLLTVTELYYYYDCELDLHKGHGSAR